MTGILFLAGQPDQYFYNNAFNLKVVSLTLMALNALLFYRLEFAYVRALGPYDDAPPSAKTIAAASLFFLAAVMLSARMLTFFRPPF